MSKSKKSDDSQADSASSPQASAAVLDLSTWKEVKSGLHLIPLELVVESADNARKHFDSEELGRLAASIAVTGGINTEAAIVKQIDPFLLPTPDEAALGPMPIFELVSGHRRFRALQLNGANFIKAEVKEFGGNGDRELSALVCNLHRADLNPIEKSDALQKMVPGYKTVEHLAKAVAIHSRTVQDLLNLQRLIQPARAALIDGKITTAHAVLLSREQKAEDQAKCLEACFRPEAVDNGGGMEMVPKLISEKQLRDWIKDNLRPEPVEQPKLFGTEEERKDAAKTAELDRAGDAILDQAREGGAAEAETSDVQQDTAASDAKAEESDITDDDLTPEQAAAVKPEDADEFFKEQQSRIGTLKRVCDAIGKEPDVKVEALRQIVTRDVMRLSKENYALFIRIRGVGESAQKFAQGIATEKIESLCPLALLQDVVALAFISELNPNVSDRILCDLYVPVGQPSKSEKVKTAKPKAKSIKSPSASEVSKVMKAEKAKLATKRAKTKKPGKSKR